MSRFQDSDAFRYIDHLLREKPKSHKIKDEMRKKVVRNICTIETESLALTWPKSGEGN